MTKELVISKSENIKAEGLGLFSFMNGDAPRLLSVLNARQDQNSLFAKNNDDLEQKRGLPAGVLKFFHVPLPPHLQSNCIKM